jgi:sugar lactone lactonase YvrE
MSSAFNSMIRCLAKTADVCGEGVLYEAEHGAVFWTDINRGLIHRLELASGFLQTWNFDQPVISLLQTSDPKKILVVLGGRVIIWEPETDRRDSVVFTLAEWPKVRCNDAGIDPDGGLWMGTMQNNVAADGSSLTVVEALGELFSVHNDGVKKVFRTQMLIENTVAWSPDGKRMYFADTLRNEIYVCDFERSTRQLAGYRIFQAGFSRGYPDGSAMDAEGFLWNCRYGGSCIVRFAPDGTVDRTIEMPVPNPTCCAFGGSDLRTLFVTSAAEGKSDASLEDGGLFSFETSVVGAVKIPFRL